MRLSESWTVLAVEAIQDLQVAEKFATMAAGRADLRAPLLAVVARRRESAREKLAVLGVQVGVVGLGETR